MKRSTHLVVTLAGLLGFAVAVPGVATAAPPAKTMSFSSSSYSVSEKAGHATVTVQRPVGNTRVTVRIATSNGTAQAPGDYTAVNKTIVFPAGRWYYHHTSIDVSIPIVDNSVANADKTFTVSLSRPSGGYQLASPSTATVTIVNDDVPAAPSGLTANAVGSDEIDLAWTANTDYVTGYRVLRSTTPGGPYSQIATPTTNSYQDTGLAAGTYYYVVQAVNPAGDSPNSGEASASVPSQTDLMNDGGFESGFSGWYVGNSAGSTISLDTSAPHSGTYSAHLASDGSQQTYPSLEGSFYMPSSMPSTETVTFTGWYKAAISSSDYSDIALYDYDAKEYIGSDFQLNDTTVTSWTQTPPLVLDSSRAGHLILVLVDINASGASTFDVDDFTALVG